MWANIISIGNELISSYGVPIDRLENIENLTYSEERSPSRTVITLATNASSSVRIKAAVEKVISDYILLNVKCGFIKDELKIPQPNYAQITLICAMLCFDNAFERSELKKVYVSTRDYNVDAICNFRIKEIKKNWKELIRLAQNLLSLSGEYDDILSVAAYLSAASGGERNSLLIYKINNELFLKNLTSGESVEIFPLFDNSEFNLLYAVISQRPMKITLEDVYLSSELISVLKRIARVK